MRRSALTCGLSRMTSETSDRETPARRATSSIVVCTTPSSSGLHSEATFAGPGNGALQDWHTGRRGSARAVAGATGLRPHRRRTPTRAIELGLADAQWYRPPIDPLRLQALTTRTNGRAARDVVLWLALLVARRRCWRG